MDILVLILLSALLLLAIYILVDTIKTNKKIEKKITSYKQEINELYGNLEYLYQREKYLERLDAMNLNEFTGKLREDFYNEMVLCSDGTRRRIIDLLTLFDRFDLRNQTILNILNVYEKYCDKLYTIEKYAQKEQPAKRPLGRPRKEK
jgi:hypothetical protein